MRSLFYLGGNHLSNLSKVTTEEAFDALPYVMDVYEKLDLDNYRKKVSKQYKGADIKKLDVNEIGIDLFKYVIRNLAKAKEELFMIVAVMDKKSPEEVKQQPITQTIKSIKEIFNDKELMDFFKESV